MTELDLGLQHASNSTMAHATTGLFIDDLTASMTRYSHTTNLTEQDDESAVGRL